MNNYYYVNNVNISTDSIISQAPQLIAFAKKETAESMKNYRHMHSHLEIFYYIDGEGIFEFDNEPHPIKPGTMVIVNSKNIHIQYPTGEKPLTFYNLMIDNVNIYGLPNNSLSVRGALIANFESSDNCYLRTIDRIHRELDEKKSDYYSKITALLYELLVDLRRLFPIKKEQNVEIDSAATPSIIHKTKDYIDSHFLDDLTLDDIIKRTYLNKSYFLKQFKKYFGVSPMQYMMSVRLQHAQLLLTKTELSVSEIAFSLQFSNFSYFSEIFKQHFGVSPSEFRRYIKTSVKEDDEPPIDQD